MTKEEGMPGQGRGIGRLRRAVTAVEKEIAYNDFETAASGRNSKQLTARAA